MSLFEIFYQLVFGPLELIFETVYGIAYDIVDNPGTAIIPLSLCINFFLLPLYMRADAIQREERAREKSLAPGVARIKQAFKGDERYMMLMAYYRINHYKPVYALRCAFPLLLQIPFFVAAFHFLSNQPVFYGANWGPFANLAEPDGLLRIGGFSVNLLPILMTLINLLASSIYLKDLSIKDKVQLYGVALIFLVLLYNSPSGLVFYWTLNNVFSLFKNIVYASKNRRVVTCSILSVLGLMFILYALFVYGKNDWSLLLVLLIGIVFQIPTIRQIVVRRKNGDGAGREDVDVQGTGKRQFVLGCLFITFLTGVLIPSSVIKASPAEFVIMSAYQTPLWYVLSAFLLAAGTFLIWFGLFYYFANYKIRRIMSAGICIVSVLAIVDYMFFGTNLGNLSAELKYDLELDFSVTETIVNLEILLFTGTVVLIIWLKKRVLISMLLPALIFAVGVISILNVADVMASTPQIEQQISQWNNKNASIPLSRNGKNVIVLMIDRAISSYVPYLMQEKPELVRQFDGFTWYPNTLSFGKCTNVGSPSLFGGYEYMPEAINRRNREKLSDKQNEALKVMPVLFSRAGYGVTVCDPPYAGYTWIPDLSIYDEYEGISAYHTQLGQFVDSQDTGRDRRQILMRNMFCFSLMKTSPLLVQPGLYQDGTYHIGSMNGLWNVMQERQNKSIAFGVARTFINAFAAISSLSRMTRIMDGDKGYFMMMNNNTAHDVIMLQEPQYIPSLYVNNTVYDEAHRDRFIVNGRIMHVETPFQMAHYHSNMAAFLQIGKWFDFLREQGVYDNTRIIIVADHGYELGQFPDMWFGDTPQLRSTYDRKRDVMAYNPLLMVKDFGSKGFRTDYQFMTNADTPTLAFDRLIDKPVNPFTGKLISSEEKNAEELHVFYTDEWDTKTNNGSTFEPGFWFSLKNQNIFDMGNWAFIGEW